MSDELSNSFIKSRKNFSDKFKEIFTGAIDDELYEDLMELLILSDVDPVTAESVINSSKSKLKRKEMSDEEAVKKAVKESALELLHDNSRSYEIIFPCIILVAGVNGVGKTTTIAKLVNLFKNEGKTVMLSAADTFRAAASEQLSIWAERLNVPIIKSIEGQDPSGVIYDSIDSANSKNIDVLICDTAGRLQNKSNLMNEFAKIIRVTEKNALDRNIYELIILDSMTGRNSLTQLEEFSSIREPDGIVLTKTDSAAKGGILLSISNRTNIPIWYIGTGEGIDDIEIFDPQKYVDSIF